LFKQPYIFYGDGGLKLRGIGAEPPPDLQVTGLYAT